MTPRIDVAELGRRLDLDKRPRSWGGTCPACNYARAFTLKSGKRGGVRAYCANGCTREQLDDALTRTLGTDWTPPSRLPDEDAAAQRQAKQAAAMRLFGGSTPLTATDAAGRYLARRGLSAFLPCPALRFRGDAPHQNGGRHPALVAEIVDAAGKPIAAHRTYLARDGSKAALDPGKMSLGPMWGGAVRLTLDPMPPTALAIGEGIETSASAGLLLDLPAWAALSAGNMGGGLVLPDVVRNITVAADADPVGQREAHTAARRWRAEGRTVRIVTPTAAGADFNDTLQQAACARAGEQP